MIASLKIADQNFLLHPSGAAYWKEEQTLLLADIHFGKVAHFRKHGAAIPMHADQHNYEKLYETLKYFKPKKVYFLGDLFHSSLNNSWSTFESWVTKQTENFTLITGNHDIIAAHKFEAIGIQVIEEWKCQNFHLSHHPIDNPTAFNICGHVHPGIRMQGDGKQQLRLRCFYKSSNQLILPAFGAFTGKHIIRPISGDEIFVIAEQSVIPISTIR